VKADGDGQGRFDLPGFELVGVDRECDFFHIQVEDVTSLEMGNQM